MEKGLIAQREKRKTMSTREACEHVIAGFLVAALCFIGIIGHLLLTYQHVPVCGELGRLRMGSRCANFTAVVPPPLPPVPERELIANAIDRLTAALAETRSSAIE